MYTNYIYIYILICITVYMSSYSNIEYDIVHIYTHNTIYLSIVDCTLTNGSILLNYLVSLVNDLATYQHQDRWLRYKT